MTIKEIKKFTKEYLSNLMRNTINLIKSKLGVEIIQIIKKNKKARKQTIMDFINLKYFTL